VHIISRRESANDAALTGKGMLGSKLLVSLKELHLDILEICVFKKYCKSIVPTWALLINFEL